MKIKSALIIALIPFVILLFNFRLVVFDLGFYKSEFEKLGVYRNVPEADNVAFDLIQYLKSSDVQPDFFNEKEKLHLKDVKELINKLIIVLYVSLIIFVASFFILKKKLFFNALFRGTILTIFVIFIFFLMSFFDFSLLFVQFHKIFFSNDLWLLNPVTDNLLKLFPEQFFYGAFKKILINSLITAIVLNLISLGLIKKFK